MYFLEKLYPYYFLPVEMRPGHVNVTQNSEFRFRYNSTIHVLSPSSAIDKNQAIEMKLKGIWQRYNLYVEAWIGALHSNITCKCLTKKKIY